ncbi:MAG: hypothetical protein EOP48_23000 [Sphingobacteriales bacterium]|nr:MAG: hypothetical protein EOP48_23000 [Sphingobacteriales bacterium]
MEGVIMEETDKVKKILREHKVARASDLAALNVSRLQLSRLATSGEIISLGAGYYAHSSQDPFIASIIAVSRQFPEGVISKASALVIHSLSDERIDQIDIDIARGTSIRNRLVHAHRTTDTFRVGVERLDFHGEKIRIYNIERSLSEAYKMGPDSEIFLKAIKRYSARVDPQYDKIAEYDSLLSTNVLRAVRQELADG